MTHPVFAVLADDLAQRDFHRPLRVGIDGITAAGKTTFANRLGRELEDRGRTVIRVSMDGFHNPRSVRYRQGRGSADGYYEDAYDLASVKRLLLDPLGDGGDRDCRTAIIDLASDTLIDAPPTVAEPDSILIVDGSFLQKAEIRRSWDIVVYLRTSFEAAERRGVQRDSHALGGTEAATVAFRSRYHQAQRRYLAECRPDETADVVVDAEDPTRPRLIRRVPTT